VITTAEVESLFIVIDPSCTLSYEIMNVDGQSSSVFNRVKASGHSASVETAGYVGEILIGIKGLSSDYLGPKELVLTQTIIVTEPIPEKVVIEEEPEPEVVEEEPEEQEEEEEKEPDVKDQLSDSGGQALGAATAAWQNKADPAKVAAMWAKLRESTKKKKK